MANALNHSENPAALVCAVMSKHQLSIRGLARRCGIAPASALAWTEGRAIPSDSHGLTLAALLGTDPLKVLITLQLARSDCPDGRKAWRQLLAEHEQTKQGDRPDM